MRLIYFGWLASHETEKKYSWVGTWRTENLQNRCFIVSLQQKDDLRSRLKSNAVCLWKKQISFACIMYNGCIQLINVNSL